ncbi:hypothetical protein BC829DRAFT_388203 [Chytridium lagenaria]|nr:hypothetical protein BC829DRAFT_388203 [Chytridium lagenaria]
MWKALVFIALMALQSYALLIAPSSLSAVDALRLVVNDDSPVAPLLNAKESNIIKDRYIISLRDGVSWVEFMGATQVISELVQESLKENPHFTSLAESPIVTLGSGLDGFPKGLVVTLDKTRLDYARRLPQVEFVENDQIITIRPDVSL